MVKNNYITIKDDNGHLATFTDKNLVSEVEDHFPALFGVTLESILFLSQNLRREGVLTAENVKTILDAANAHFTAEEEKKKRAVVEKKESSSDLVKRVRKQKESEVKGG